METKDLIKFLNVDTNGQFCISSKTGRQIAGLLQELEIEKLNNEQLRKHISDLEAKQQPEWISVEDKPLPKLSGEINRMWHRYPNDLPVYIAFYGNGASNGVTHWMQLDPPKPKVLTFKEKFLESFPKAQPYDMKCCLVFTEQFLHDSCDFNCDSCWNQPYFEEEGESDA